MKRLRLSDAPERLSGEECEPAGGAPLRATTSAVHLTGEFNQQSIGGLGGHVWRQRDPNKRAGRADFSAFRLPVGALRLLRVAGRVCDRAGNGVRCGLPNVTSLPPLPNDASVPWQCREARL
jgi:hypothetical protein